MTCSSEHYYTLYSDSVHNKNHVDFNTWNLYAAARQL